MRVVALFAGSLRTPNERPVRQRIASEHHKQRLAEQEPMRFRRQPSRKVVSDFALSQRRRGLPCLHTGGICGGRQAQPL
jgi:hypothetical protein